MEKSDPAEVAIVFWTYGRRGARGDVTRFDSLEDAIHSVMETPSAKCAPVAWIRTADRHLPMDEIRRMARRFTLASRLARVAPESKNTGRGRQN
jgi:hypothetical protein